MSANENELLTLEEALAMPPPEIRIEDEDDGATAIPHHIIEDTTSDSEYYVGILENKTLGSWDQFLTPEDITKAYHRDGEFDDDEDKSQEAKHRRFRHQKSPSLSPLHQITPKSSDELINSVLSINNESIVNNKEKKRFHEEEDQLKKNMLGDKKKRNSRQRFLKKAHKKTPYASREASPSPVPSPRASPGHTKEGESLVTAEESLESAIAKILIEGGKN